MVSSHLCLVGNDGINKVVISKTGCCHSKHLSFRIVFKAPSKKIDQLAAIIESEDIMFLHKYFHPICVSVAMTPLIRLSTILHFKNWMWPLGCHRNRAKGEHCCCLRLTYLKAIIDYQVGHNNFLNYKQQT